MYLSCSCGEYPRRHKPTDVTMDDLKAAAKGKGMAIPKVVGRLQEAG
jgi:hypothetical protein